MKTVQATLNEEGVLLGEVVNGDPKHPESWEYVLIKMVRRLDAPMEMVV